MPNGFSGRELEAREQSEGEEEGGKGEKVTEHRTCRSGVAECITSRDGIHLWKEGKGPYPIVIHWTRRCYEWMDKSMAHRICTFSLPIKQTNNLFYVVSSLTFPRIWRRFFCGVLLVSLLSLFDLRLMGDLAVILSAKYRLQAARRPPFLPSHSIMKRTREPYVSHQRRRSKRTTKW